MTLGLGDTLLRIPDEVEHLVPCLQNPGLYTDPALDIDQDDVSWVMLTTAEQNAQISARQAAEARAVAACNTCPILADCREWAMEQGSGVFGVAGGLTYEQRTGDKIIAVNPTLRGPFGQVRDDLIARWTAAGIPNSTIAQWLDCDVRTVERRRERLLRENSFSHLTGEGSQEPDPLSADKSMDPGMYAVASGRAKAAVKAATSPLLPGRVTAETAALFDALCNGGQRDRSEIVDSVLHVVDRQTALAKAPAGRNYANEDAQVRTGARKFIMNRLDIAVRSGRIIEVTTENGKKLISMEPSSAEVWRRWREYPQGEAEEIFTTGSSQPVSAV